MAQTIAVYRGLTSCATTGTSRVTLFTQSGGTATRVILCGVSANVSDGNGYRMSLNLTINVNGSGNYLPVAMIAGNNNTYMRYLNMMPNGVSTSSGSWFAGTTTSISLPNAIAIGSNTDGGFGVTATNSGTVMAAPGNVTEYVNSNPINYVPSQFWMANGDSLTAQCYLSNTGYTAYIVYHFVTITES